MDQKTEKTESHKSFVLSTKVRSKVILLLALVVLLLVVAAGAYYYRYINSKSSDDTASTVTTTDTTTTTTAVDATADWKTYTSTAFSYSIKYPTDWTLADAATVFGANSIALTSPETKKTNDDYAVANPTSRAAVFPNMGVTYYASISDTYGGLGGAKPATLADYVKTSGFSDSKQITFAGQTAYSATQAGDVSGYVIVLESSGHIYKISSLNKKVDSDLTTTEKNILNTFAIDPTLGWKTYTNTEVGFTLKYPQDWSSMKLNLIDNLKDGYGGKFISSSDGKNGIVHFDPDKSFDISAQAKAYIQGLPVINTSYSQVKVDTSWSVADLQTNMFGAQAIPEVLMVKKLSNKSLLVYDYFNSECSPSSSLKVVTALNSEFPNIEISITSSSAAMTADSAAARLALKEDVCDGVGSSRQIAEKIKNGDYSDLNAKIETARLIADSLTYDETLTWKTYTDTAFGYSVKYPADWTKGVLADSATFNSPKNEAIKNSGTQNEAYSPNIIVQTVSSLAEFTKFNNDDKTLDSFIRNDVTNSEIAVTTLDGEKAYKYLTGGIGDAYYQIAAEHNSKVYWIHFSPGELSATQDKITSTFQFTN
ncbi:MAG: hypothetical protein WC227_04435 [Patescibacteria group bacterium]